jgi:phosphoribosylformylglycinamidine cyclo-ligase
VIYVKFVEAAQQAGIDLHYAVHVTGHGWRKLMRLDRGLVYRINDVRPPGALFEFLMQQGPIDRREAYATFNMGVGFAVYVDPRDADATLRVARESGYDAWLAGEVRDEGGRKAVEIAPLGITFDAGSLNLRG